ncbi:MAG: SigmaK-factor processing regulatory protein BofA [Anaerocolumna sp.]|jgi:inhibitor of the pro-sigma K processing machinery|nr:SigmaK-factor processing regulatory protein BofA [Anaerocolumna sp.]
MESTIFVIIIIICVALILFGVIKHRFDLIVNFGLRIFAGLLGIYLLNTLFDSIGVAIIAGTNCFNALVVGLLGVPGFLLVFGVATYFYFVK